MFEHTWAALDICIVHDGICRVSLGCRSTRGYSAVAGKDSRRHHDRRRRDCVVGCHLRELTDSSETAQAAEVVARRYTAVNHFCGGLAMRKGVCTGFALVLSVAVAACGGSKGQAGAASRGGAGSTKQYAELRWGDVPFPGVIDLQKSPFGSAELVESLVVQDLVEFEPNGTLKPGLASSIE